MKNSIKAIKWMFDMTEKEASITITELLQNGNEDFLLRCVENYNNNAIKTLWD